MFNCTVAENETGKRTIERQGDGRGECRDKGSVFFISTKFPAPRIQQFEWQSTRFYFAPAGIRLRGIMQIREL